MSRQVVVSVTATLLLLWTDLLSALPPLPKPDHIVLVIEENHAFSQIVDSPAAPISMHWQRKGHC